MEAFMANTNPTDIAAQVFLDHFRIGCRPLVIDHSSFFEQILFQVLKRTVISYLSLIHQLL